MATTEPPADTELGPFKEQEKFLGDDKKYYGYVSGVGAGKTYAGILRTALNMEEWNPGEMGAIVAPTSTMVKDVIISQMREVGLLDHWEYKTSHTEEPGIHAPNGSRALILSADNRRTIERLRGLNLAWWWIDEEAEVNERARDILTQRLRVGNYRNGYITTTPKGKNHTYDFFVGGVEGVASEYGAADIYETGDRLAILRVPSHANPNTPDDYKEQLDRDHDGQFYEQEVMGDFVAFEGLIYPWFDGKNLVTPVDPTVETWDETIYGVDWGHNNPSTIVALIRRGESWTVVEEYHETRRTVNDHSRALEDMQERWGPGAVYADPSEPANIEQFRRDGLDAHAAENDVTPGIQRVSAMQDALRVVETCQNLRNEFSQYQYKDGKDKPEKTNDHCFVAGTPVLTEHGECPIETIVPGDRVLTRDGYKRVLGAGKTAENEAVLTAYLSDGRTLTGTPGHPIHTKSEGFVQLDSLSYANILTTTERSHDVCQTSNLSSTTESRSDGTLTPRDAPTANTIGHQGTTFARGLKRSIGKYGRTLTALMKSLPAMLSTTSTGTRTITAPETSNASPRPNTFGNTQTSRSPTKRLKTGSKPQRNGTTPTKDVNGTASTGKNPSDRCLRILKQKTATSAARNLSTSHPPGSAQTPAKRKRGASAATTTNSVSALSAASHSRSTNTKNSRPVRVLAVERSKRGRTVYNLTVKDKPEYYANGILVHNCLDALRYALFTHVGTGSVPTGTVDMRDDENEPSGEFRETELGEAVMGAVDRMGGGRR